MSIAGIVLGAPEERLAELEAALRDRETVVEIQRTPDDALIPGLAVVVAQPSDRLQAELKSLSRLPGVEDVHLVYADYQDDLDAEGHMPCPPHESKSRRGDPA